MNMKEYLKHTHPTQRLYNAERETMFWMKSDKFATCDDARAWLCAIHDSEVYRKKIRIALPSIAFVEPLEDWDAVYYPNPGLIEMGRVRTEAALLHELSHHIAIHKHGPVGMRHDLCFVRTYLGCVLNFHSKEAAQELLHSFDRHGIMYA